MATQEPAAGGPGRWIAMGKDLLGLLRDLALVALFAMLILAPGFVGQRLRDAGFVKGSVMGFDWEARSEVLGMTSRQLEQSLQDARRQLEIQAQTIAANQKVIAQLGVRAGEGDAVRQLTRRNAAVLQGSRAVEAATAKTLRATAPVLNEARATAGDAEWAVVLGGDQARDAAQYEVGRASRAGLDGAELYLRQGWYRTVWPARDRAAATAALGSARRFQPSAYVVDLRAWCPTRSARDGVTSCG